MPDRTNDLKNILVAENKKKQTVGHLFISLVMKKAERAFEWSGL